MATQQQPGKQPQAQGRQPQVTRGRETSGERGLARREQALSPWWSLDPFTTGPFTMMRRMMQDMDRLFGGFGFGGGGLTESWYPQLEVSQKNGEIVVCADLPGLKPEDVKIEVQDDNTLCISGERRYEKEQEEGGYYRSERSYGSFCRTIALPEGADLENASASFENGVLEVHVNVPEQKERSKRIEIKPRTESGGGEIH